MEGRVGGVVRMECPVDVTPLALPGECHRVCGGDHSKGGAQGACASSQVGAARHLAAAVNTTHIDQPPGNEYDGGRIISGCVRHVPCRYVAIEFEVPYPATMLPCW